MWLLSCLDIFLPNSFLHLQPEVYIPWKSVFCQGISAARLPYARRSKTGRKSCMGPDRQVQFEHACGHVRNRTSAGREPGLEALFSRDISWGGAYNINWNTKKTGAFFLISNICPHLFVANNLCLLLHFLEISAKWKLCVYFFSYYIIVIIWIIFAHILFRIPLYIFL